MCPVCMTTFVLFVAGSSTAAGLAALAVMDFYDKSVTKISTERIGQTTQVKGGNHESAENCRARSMAGGA
jgi:hypothetical protein